MAPLLPKIPTLVGKNYHLKFELLSTLTIGNNTQVKVLTDGQMINDANDKITLLKYTYFYPYVPDGSAISEDRTMIYDRRGQIWYKINDESGQCIIQKSGDSFMNLTFPDNFTIPAYFLANDTTGYDFNGRVSNESSFKQSNHEYAKN